MELIELPKSLNSINLKQYVEWNVLYGNDLLNKTKKQLSDGEMILFEVELLTKHYCYYSNTPLKTIEELIFSKNEFINEILKESSISQAIIFREMCDLKNIDLLNSEFEFNKQIWKIKPPFYINNQKDITLEQFELIQDIALIFSDLEDGNTKAFYELCALYLHAEDATNDHSKDYKVELMKTLPLRIALCVKKYIEETISLYKVFSKPIK